MFAARIAAPEFQTRLAAIAAYHARRGECADDIQSEITVRLLERAAAVPTFAQQSDNYLSKYAGWMARHAARGNRVYTHYVDPETFDAPVPSMDGDDSITYGELVPDAAPSVEDTAAARVDLARLHARLASLTRKQRAVAELILNGATPAEAAKELHIEPSAVRHILARMRAALAN